MRQNGYRGLSWSLLRIFLKQILDALSVLSASQIIHCDLKPENILLNKLTAPDITLIDFGSACFETQTVYSYIQSRFYRSPEVLIGVPYNSAIDLWSFGQSNEREALRSVCPHHSPARTELDADALVLPLSLSSLAS
jgi:dual specificity protein kinase YAK1